MERDAARLGSFNEWMDQRRQMLSAVVAVACFFVWLQVAPILFPAFFPKPNPAGGQAAAPAPAAEKPADGQNQPNDAQVDAADPAPEKPVTEEDFPEFPEKTIVLGDAGFDAGYLLKAELTTRGAAINAVWLTDPRYTTDDRKAQLKIVGNELKRNVGDGPVPRTFETTIPEVDEVLKAAGQSLASVNWEVVKQDAESVTFRYPVPGGKLEVIKTFTIPKADLKTRDKDVAGYLMDVEIELRNLSEQPIETKYILQGPVGVPLENTDNTRTFREIKIGALENPHNPNKVTSTSLLANDLVKQYDKAQAGGPPVEDWRAPLRFAGVDDQFFAALVLPQGDQLGGKRPDGNPSSIIAITRPELLYKDTEASHSAMSIELESPELKVPAKGTVTNEFHAFFGPKRPELLRELNAESIIQLGWFAPVAKLMLWILGFFHHSLHLPYAWAIIALTVVVRMAMLPISRKQAIEAEKMKILAPKMKEIQEKHKNNPEEFARAYREFQKKHNYHPLMGCLPALIQLPIFLGLYNSLYHAVDLRLARFLWIDNLAEPDRLFPLPFVVPWFGWTEFNLLPIITVCLFVVQQKMFTPPPTSEEQAMQYKMMNVMMIAIGFAFYRVPAGLCLYFISSSLWGVCERLWLKKSLVTHQQALAEAAAEENTPTIVDKPKPKAGQKPEKAKAPTWWDKLREAADQANKQATSQPSQRKFSKKNKGGKGS